MSPTRWRGGAKSSFHTHYHQETDGNLRKVRACVSLRAEPDSLPLLAPGGLLSPSAPSSCHLFQNVLFLTLGLLPPRPHPSTVLYPAPTLVSTQGPNRWGKLCCRILSLVIVTNSLWMRSVVGSSSRSMRLDLGAPRRHTSGHICEGISKEI